MGSEISARRRRALVRTVYKQTAAFIAEIIDDGKSRHVFRRDIDSTKTAHAILGGLIGAELQCRVIKTLSFPDLVSGMKDALLHGILDR